MPDQWGQWNQTDSGELWDKAKRHIELGHEAYRSAQAKAAGSSREQVREIYLEELRPRGVPSPPNKR